MTRHFEHKSDSLRSKFAAKSSACETEPGATSACGKCETAAAPPAKCVEGKCRACKEPVADRMLCGVWVPYNLDGTRHKCIGWGT